MDAFLLLLSHPCPQAAAIWGWSNWLAAEAIRAGKELLLLNLDETPIPLTFPHTRGNVMRLDPARAWLRAARQRSASAQLQASATRRRARVGCQRLKRSATRLRNPTPLLLPLPLGRQFWDARFLSLENDWNEKTWSRYHDRLRSEHGIQALIARA